MRLHQSRRCFTANFQREPLAAATAGSRGWAAAWKSNSKCTQACEFVAARVVQKKHFKITTFFLLYKMTFFGFDVSLASSRSDVHGRPGRMTQATCLTKLVPAAARARVDASEPPFQSQPPCMRIFATIHFGALQPIHASARVTLHHSHRCASKPQILNFFPILRLRSGRLLRAS